MHKMYCIIVPELSRLKKIKIQEYQGIEGLIDIHTKQDILIANKITKILNKF